MAAVQVVSTLLCLPVDQKEIKFQNLAGALSAAEPKFQPWDILELYRAFYPLNGQVDFSGCTSAPTVAETAISLKDQTDKYQSALYGLTQATEANREFTADVHEIYVNASREERLKHKLFYARMLEQTNELNKTFKAVLADMDQIDARNKKSPTITAVGGLPKEIWVHILNQFDNESLQLCEPVIRATCYPLNVIAREYKPTRSGYYSIAVGSILVKAAANGHLSYVKFLHQVGRKLKFDVMLEAALSGNLELVKFVHGNGIPINWTVVLRAAKSGSFQVYLYALENSATSSPYSSDREFSTASLEGGNIDIITSAMHHVKQHVGLVDEYDTICKHKSAKDIIELLTNNGVPVNNWKKNKGWTMSSAKYGNIECLKYLIEQGFEVHEDCAAMAQSIDCVQYLFERGFTNPQLIDNAAKIGDLDVIRFGYEVCRYPLTATAANLTVLYNNGACLQYLLNNNCPVDPKQIWKTVASMYRDDMVKLLFKKVPFDSPVYFQAAMQYHNIDKNKNIMWLAQQGVPLPDNICDLAAQRGHYDLLVFAHSKGKPFSKDIVTRAAESRSLACLEYVLDNGGVITNEAVNYVGGQNDVKGLAMLLERGGPIPADLEMTMFYSEAHDTSKYYSEFMKQKSAKK